MTNRRSLSRKSIAVVSLVVLSLATILATYLMRVRGLDADLKFLGKWSPSVKWEGPSQTSGYTMYFRTPYQEVYADLKGHFNSSKDWSVEEDDKYGFWLVQKGVSDSRIMLYRTRKDDAVPESTQCWLVRIRRAPFFGEAYDSLFRGWP